MEIKETTGAIADFLWDLLIDGGDDEDLASQAEEAGLEDVSPDQMMAALATLNGRVANSDAVQDQQLSELRSAVQTLASRPPVVNQVREVTEVTEVNRVVNQQVVERNVQNNVEQTFVENKTIVEQTFIDEGDVITENTTITQINARGNVRFDQEVNNTVVTAEDGAVALAGGLEDSVVNTGVNTGVIAGDDATLEDSVIGDDNVQVNDTEADALAIGGDATNAEGENVNLGSGELVDSETGGDAQIVVGDENEADGDVDVTAEGVDGPLNATIGDDNAQQGLEDNSESVSDSGNLDVSTNDSGNLEQTDSGNVEVEDNDTTISEIVDSGNVSTEDNDIETFSLEDEFNETIVVEDNDETLEATLIDQEEVTVIGDDNEISLTDDPALTDPALSEEPEFVSLTDDPALSDDSGLDQLQDQELLDGE